MRTRGGTAGFTLVEMLVVLAIVGAMAGVTVLSIGAGNRGGGGDAEAHRLAARLRLAADETMVTDEALAFVADARGYGFVKWDAGAKRWRPETVDALAHHDLPSAFALTTDSGARPLVIGADGAGGPMTATLAGAGSRWVVRFDGTDATVDRGR